MSAARPGGKYHDPSILQCCGYPLSSRRVAHSVDFVFSKSVGSSIVRWNILAPPLHFRGGGVEHQKAAPPLAGPDRQIMAMWRPAHTETGAIQLDRRSWVTFFLPNFRGSRIISVRQFPTVRRECNIVNGASLVTRFLQCSVVP